MTSSMTFEESIIIPLSIFKKCKFDDTQMQKDQTAASTANILNDENLSADEKMKLYRQEKLLHRQPTVRTNTTAHTDDASETHIIKSVGSKYQPYVKSILDFIKRNEHEVAWDKKTLEIILNGKSFPDSDISKAIQIFMKNAVITQEEKDIPTGTRQLYRKLIDLGLPKSWIPTTFKIVRRSKRAKNPLTPPRWDTFS